MANVKISLTKKYKISFWIYPIDRTDIETSVMRGSDGATYETMSGLLEGMEDSNVKYKLSTQLNDSLFMANCAHHSQDTATNILYKSLPYKPSCVNWALDLLKLPWVPTAIKSYNGRGVDWWVDTLFSTT